MTGPEALPSCGADGNRSYAEAQGEVAASTERAPTAGELFGLLWADDRAREARVASRPGLRDVLEPPEHARPSGVDPGITVSGGVGGIRARLDDMNVAVGMLKAQVEDLEAVAEQAAGLARDAESWSLLLQDRLEASRAGAEASGVAYAEQAVASFRSRLAAALFAADRCSTRATGLARDVEDVATALDGARKKYETAERKAEGYMLTPENSALRGTLAGMRGASFGLGTGFAAAWGWSNAVDKVAGWAGLKTNVRGVLPDTQELLGSIVDHYGLALAGPFAGTDPRGALNRAGRLLAKGLDKGGLLQHDAEVTKRPRSAFIPPARDLAGVAVALHAVSKVSDGAVGVQRVRRPDGTSAWTVFVPGTQADYLEKASHGRDWPSAEGTTSGLVLAASKAPIAALQKAGARPGDSVSFVGHSQGGAIAKQAAANAEVQKLYDVGSVVVFAGTEPGNVAADPPGVNVINIYDTADIVPMLDGRSAQADHNHVNVMVNGAEVADEKLRALGSDQSGRHTMGTHVETAARLARSQDPSLRHAAARLAEDLTGGALAPVTGRGAQSPTSLLEQLDGGVQIFDVRAK
ncbi:hypothetical protein ATL41_1779 [Flavimobilis soli]|uniref:Alpha/beta hydrolase family protein n=1 Tax=Flavimobilis soli TaxID=442709 RepID=A0A2A9EFH6_9MICO|nr:hypothetical protein [Flavimobilis soli]PFG37035.1 hypothetical protein ATL41_1779 [Flavimobilis soli]